jgi:hypothetical protein
MRTVLAVSLLAVALVPAVASAEPNAITCVTIPALYVNGQPVTTEMRPCIPTP